MSNRKRFLQMRTVGAWLMSPISFLLLLLISATALISYVNPLLFTNIASLAPAILGSALSLGMLSAIGAIVFFVASAAIFFLKKKASGESVTVKLKDEGSFKEALKSLRPLVKAFLIIGLIEFVVMLVLVFGSGGVLTPFFDMLSQTLLSGVGGLATLFSPGVMNVLVEIFFLFAPVILAGLSIFIVSTWVKPKDGKPELRDSVTVEDSSSESSSKSEPEQKSGLVYTQEEQQLLKDGWYLALTLQSIDRKSKTMISYDKNELIWISPPDENYIEGLLYGRKRAPKAGEESEGYLRPGHVTRLSQDKASGKETHSSTNSTDDNSSQETRPIETYTYYTQEEKVLLQNGWYLASTLTSFSTGQSSPFLSYNKNELIWISPLGNHTLMNGYLHGQKRHPKEGEKSKGYLLQGDVQRLSSPQNKASGQEIKTNESTSSDSADDNSSQETKSIDLHTDSDSDQAPYTYTKEEADIANKTGRFLAIALYEFDGNPAVHQLTLAPNDLIWVTDSHPEEDWWVGAMKDPGHAQQEGYFPKTYVQALPLKTSVKVEPNNSNKKPKDNSFISQGSFIQTPAKPTYTYTSEDFEIIRKNPWRRLLVTKYDYEGDSSKDQIRFASGEYIWVINNDPAKDLWHGEKKNPKTGELTEGYFPKAFVDELPPPNLENKQNAPQNQSSSKTLGGQNYF